MNLRFTLACASVFVAAVFVGHRIPNGLDARRAEEDPSGPSVPSSAPVHPAGVAYVHGSAPTDPDVPDCVDERRALASAEQALAERRRAIANETTIAERRPRPSEDAGDRRDLEARFTALIDRADLEGLSVDCEESPCLVFGAGTRDVVGPLADALDAEPGFADLRAVVVSRSVVDRDRTVDTLSALALMPRDDYDDATARDEFEAKLRSRLGQLQR